MKRTEFLAMIALENAVSGIEPEPTTYGFATWSDMYRVLSGHEEVAYESITGEWVWLTEDEARGGHTLATALQKAYNEAAWVITRAQEVGGLEE